MLSEWIKYLWEMYNNGSIYVRGAQGQFGDQITDKWIAQREYNDQTQINRVKKTLQQRIEDGYDKSKIYAFDCSGLGMYFIQNLKHISNTDLPSYGMIDLCDKIERSNVSGGDFLFKTDEKGKINHVAFAVDDKYCIEAKGRDVGVCLSLIDDRGFTIFGRPKFLREEIEKSIIENEIGKTTEEKIINALRSISNEIDLICETLVDYYKKS